MPTMFIEIQPISRVVLPSLETRVGNYSPPPTGSCRNGMFPNGLATDPFIDVGSDTDVSFAGLNKCAEDEYGLGSKAILPAPCRNNFLVITQRGDVINGLRVELGMVCRVKV